MEIVIVMFIVGVGFCVLWRASVDAVFDKIDNGADANVKDTVAISISNSKEDLKKLVFNK